MQFSIFIELYMKFNFEKVTLSIFVMLSQNVIVSLYIIQFFKMLYFAYL